MSNKLKEDDNSLDKNLPYSTLCHINKQENPRPVFCALFRGREDPISFINSKDAFWNSVRGGDGVKAFL